MRRQLMAIPAVMIVGVSGISLQHYQGQAAASDPGDSVSGWAPAPVEIARQVQALPAAEQSSAFAHRFANRFRQHDQGRAVGLRFLTPNRIKLMVEARTEPWVIDEIATMAWRESQADLHRVVDVDIYETFIGSAAIKIGELRSPPGSGGCAVISYHYPRPNSGEGRVYNARHEPDTWQRLAANPMP